MTDIRLLYGYLGYPHGSHRVDRMVFSMVDAG